MATILRPTGTLVRFDGLSIVGTAGPASVWTDNSDATFKVVPNPGTGDLIFANLDLFSGGHVASVRVHVRASAVPDPSASPQPTIWSPRFQMHPTSGDLNFPLAQGFGATDLPVDGSIWDYVIFSDPIDDPDAIAAALMSDIYLSVYTDPSTIATFYEVWVEIITAGAVPLRRYPREDGYGIGPTRHYPPPKSRRAAGGYY